MTVKSASCAIGEHAKCPREFHNFNTHSWECGCRCHLAAPPAPASPQPAENGEALAVAMLAACEATIRHLWDIAGRFDNRECNLIRDEIHRLNKMTLPAICDLGAAVEPAPASVPPPSEELETLDGLIGMLEEGIENEEFARALRVAGGGEAVADDETPMPFTRAFKDHVEAFRQVLNRLRASSPAVPPPPTKTEEEQV